MGEREIKHIVPTSSCGCSKKMLYLEFNFPVKPEYLQAFTEKDYKDKKSYHNRGIFYAEGVDVIVFGPYYSNRLQVKCKGKGCMDELERIETIFKELK